MAKLSETYKQAKVICSKIESSLLPEHKGEIIAIEPTSGNYIIRSDKVKVALEGKCRHPRKKFGLFRIGAPVVHKLRRIDRMQKGRITSKDDAIENITLIFKDVHLKKEGVVDTGFNGYISIPGHILSQSNWYEFGEENYELATGEIVQEPVL